MLTFANKHKTFKEILNNNVVTDQRTDVMVEQDKMALHNDLNHPCGHQWITFHGDLFRHLLFSQLSTLWWHLKC